MARIWTEPFDPARHRNLMLRGGPPADDMEKYWRAKTLEQYEVVFVRVAGFTFQFHSVEQIRACFEFYSSKLHPSGRSSKGDADRWEAQRWFEQLPLYLQEEPKRKKVVAALEEALQRTKEFRH